MEIINISRIIPPKNPATIDKELRESIRRHGILIPLCVANIGGFYGIKDGLRRYAIALELGIMQLPVEVVKLPSRIQGVQISPTESFDPVI
mgnify:CR=1 FL=1